MIKDTFKSSSDRLEFFFEIAEKITALPVTPSAILGYDYFNPSEAGLNPNEERFALENATLWTDKQKNQSTSTVTTCSTGTTGSSSFSNYRKYY